MLLPRIFPAGMGMNFLYSYLYDHPYLSIILVVFTVWMLVDAYSRQAETYWFWAILIVPLLGGLAYFFCFTIKDFRGFNLPFFQRRESLDDLRYRAEHIPTLANDVALADRLIEQGDFAGALPPLESAQKKEVHLGHVLYSRALCLSRLGRPAEALPLLDQLLQREPRWSNYRAWHLLIETHQQNKSRSAALDSCRMLVKLAPTLEHKCLLGEFLLQEGQKEEAQRLLQDALRDHQFNPGPIRRRNRRWASAARRLLKRV